MCHFTSQMPKVTKAGPGTPSRPPTWMDGWQRPKCLSHHLLPCRVSIIQKLECKAQPELGRWALRCGSGLPKQHLSCCTMCLLTSRCCSGVCTLSPVFSHLGDFSAPECPTSVAPCSQGTDYRAAAAASASLEVLREWIPLSTTQTQKVRLRNACV